ncbi:unnamed protein product [Calypogeia fissa]
MATKGVAILKCLQGTDLEELNRSLKAYLAPLLGISGSGVDDKLRTLAKEYVPFLVQLLKICGAKLASFPSRDDSVANSMAEEIFLAMGIALDGLSILRSQLTGSFFEMELQRYGLVRRLMAWKRYGAALSQSKVLFRSLCRLTSTPDNEGSTANRATSGRASKSKEGAVKKKPSAVKSLPCDDSVLSPPREVDLGSGLPALVVAAAVDLVWCIVESSEDSLSYYQMAARLPDQLTPWISALDPGTASKQCDALFRAVYKLTLLMVADPTKYGPNLIQEFCIITLSLCASSTQSDQYTKLARKLFSTLSAQGSDWCSKSVEICTSALSEVLCNTKLRGLWASHDLSELVEWFARCCQSSGQVGYGWFSIYKLVDHINQVFPCAPVVMMGLYAVGLVLMQADTPEIRLKESRADSHELADLKKIKRLSDDPDFCTKACFMLHCAEEVLRLWLHQVQVPSEHKPTKNGSLISTGLGTSDKGTTEVVSRTVVSAARALHYVQKSFTGYVQIVWNACSGIFSEDELRYSLFDSALQKVLQLFCPVLEEGMRCRDLSVNDKDVLRKGYQVALQAALAALRLSLLLNNGIQGNFALIGDMIHTLQPEEKRWLMSSTYNMGVQLFNRKQYNLACWPLELAHKAAWAKVTSISSDNKAGALVNDMISEACAKCSALVDARDRNGEPGQARLILTDGLVQWAQAQTKLHLIRCPHSLVRSFVKLTCLQNQAIVSNPAETEVRSLYTFIYDIKPPLQVRIMGLLLEEEHTVCQAMEEQFPDTCHKMKEQITKILLNKLYTGPDFELERSRVLIRKCYDSSIQGTENLTSCIQDISEAVVSLEAALEDRKKCTPGPVASLKKQLAIAYSMMGICSYAVDHYCQEFLPNVVLSLKMWRCVLDSDVVHGGLSELQNSSTTAISEEDALVLLLYISELLSIQGYSILLREVQEMILKVIRNSKQSIADKEWVEFWMKRRAGHLLCTMPFPCGLFSTIRQTFNAAASPEEFWVGYFDLLPGSLLEAHWQSAQDFLDHKGGATGSVRSTRPDAFEYLKNLVLERLPDGQTSTQFTLQTAGLYHLIADLSLVDGDTHEALRNAKEAFQLRSRLFKYVFRNSGKKSSGGTSNFTSNLSEKENSNCLQLREGIGPSATWAWPFSVKLQHCLSHPSHWRILGDYIESLMQVGVIYEQMGTVDEAEKNFREGHRLALAQNLPWALASFSSCLGEVHRKRHLWESAERYFIKAKQVFDDLQTSRFCQYCIVLSKSLLEMRSGDLARHYWYCQEGRRSEDASQPNITEAEVAKSVTCALSHYKAAFTSLSLLVEETGQKSRPCSLEPLGRSLSIEDWPLCKWAEFGRKLMSRVLLQKGKCHVHLGELNEAFRIFEKAMSFLNISSLPHSEHTAVRRSSFPVEEGALLYHLSRLHLQRKPHQDESRDASRSRRDSDHLGKGRVQSIRWLYRAFSLCRQVPLLLHKVAKLLAILHVPPSWVGPSSGYQGSVSTDEMAEVAAYFHQASLGTTIRQQHLAVLDSKLNDANLEESQQIHPSLSKACLEKMQLALRIDPVTVESVGKQAREFWDSLPSSLVCCISFVSAEDVNMLKGNCLGSVEDSNAVADWLLVTRLSVASKPVVVLLPALPLLENPAFVGRSKSLEYSSSPYDLSDDGDGDCCDHVEEQQSLPPDVLNRGHENIQTVLQRVAAEFVSLLEESRLSTSGTQPVTTPEDKHVWWKWRMELDTRLSLLLRTVEDSWLGPFKCLLLGEPQQASVAKSFELCAVYLHDMMTSMITQEQSSNMDQNFVRILLQAVGCLRAPELEKVIAKMLGFRDYRSCDNHLDERGADCNACRSMKSEAEIYKQIKQVSNLFRAAYLLSTKASKSDELNCLLDENNGKRRSRRLAKGKAGSTNQNPLEAVLPVVSDGSYILDAQVQRQPLQLILDSDAQALPWESLPFVRDHEIYRMPSLGTMHAVYIQHQCDKSSDRSRALDIQHQCEDLSDRLKALDIHHGNTRKTRDKRVKSNKSSSTRAAKELTSEKPLDVTCVNPYNTYYILNPNGDLLSTQAAFEDWFTKQLGWKGKAGSVPTAEEYQMGLQEHDLFVYLGHGSGNQYLPERHVRRLDHCAASLLMGCSSGRLSLHGEYQPAGVVLSYLMAGCPAVVANLWDVTDGDIDRFSRCLLHSWLASEPEEENSDSGKEIRDMGDCERAMRERLNENTDFQARFTRDGNSATLENQTHLHATPADIQRMGSTIGQSRNACRLPHLIGASPVCYGVPTGVWKQFCPKNTT